MHNSLCSTNEISFICHSSLIVQYDNYLGEAACLFPSSTTSCTPGFFPTRSHLARLAGLYPSHIYLATPLYFLYVSPPFPLFVSGKISSVRRGCWSNVRLHPVNKDSMAGGSRGSIILWDTFPPIQDKYLWHWQSTFSKKHLGSLMIWYVIKCRP